MKKILIVEDDHVVATAYRKRFKDAGWGVEWAADGVEGIKAVGTYKPDVILLDLLMPRLDGIEVLKYIRSNPDLRHLPVVVFSNSYMTNLIENAWRAGADQCLMKGSTTPQSLFDAIGKAMQKAASRRPGETGPSVGQWEAAGTAGPAAPRPAAPPGSMSVPFVAVEPIRPAAPIKPRPDSVPAVQPLNYPGGLLVSPPANAPAEPLSPPVVSSPADPGTGFDSPTDQPDPVVPDLPPPVAPAHAGLVSSLPPAAELSSARTVDPEFQAEIRQLFVGGGPAKLEAMRSLALALGTLPSDPSEVATGRIAELFRKIHSLTGNAAVAGCPAIAHHASTFEAFLQELQQKPRFINASTVRTVSKALDFCSLLFRYALDGDPPDLARRILIVDGDPMSGQAIALTLEKQGLRTHLAGDPIEAMTLASTENFDLIVAATELPGMSGFEACAQLQTLPGTAGVPVLFVTPNDQFEAHANPEVIGANDVIARPFLIIELTLKADILLETRRFQSHFASAA